MISKILFSLSKTSLFGKLVGFSFEHLSFLVPVNRVSETNLTLAFYHPKPVWENHIVIVPKKKIPTLLHFSSGNIQYLLDILMIAKNLIAQCRFKITEYAVCVNGGYRQEVAQVHFHLFRGEALVNSFSGQSQKEKIYSSNIIDVVHHPCPNWETHIVIKPIKDIQPLSSLVECQSAIEEIIKSFKMLNNQFQLVKRGYTVFIQEREIYEQQRLLFHLVAGSKLDN